VLTRDLAACIAQVIINRSELTIPLILAKLEEALLTQSASARFVDTAVEMIAYAGNEESLREISRLMQIDERQFGRLVGRTLDNAANWRNPFTLAYRAFALADTSLHRHTAEWTEAALKHPSAKRLWAKAILERYGRMPGDSEWANDSIASRLKDGGSPDLRLQMDALVRQPLDQRDK